MQTSFTPDQLRDPAITAADEILRKCVHCGFCTATCPTYALLGDENDSPRGRIYLIKDMLENDRAASDAVTRHVDRCLSCLSCMTTCPSGVNYMHLVDVGRQRIARTGRRSAADRLLRWLLARVLPSPERFRLALLGARMARPFAPFLPGRLKALVKLAPPATRTAILEPRVFPAEGVRRRRVSLLAGCVQQVLDAEINAATIRLLTRHGCEVVVAEGAGCCGALAHHLGREEEALAGVRSNVRAWIRERTARGLDAIVINASGCGTMVKDYGFLLRNDPELAPGAAEVSALARDVTEVLAAVGLKATVAGAGVTVAYHDACSLQHGQGVREAPRLLLQGAGFEVRDVPEGHLCCGSAGTYNILQPELATRLRDRKAANVDGVGADVIAAGNIGCILQLAPAIGRPLVHTVQLLDWATGGPRPRVLDRANG